MEEVNEIRWTEDGKLQLNSVVNVQNLENDLATEINNLSEKFDEGILGFNTKLDQTKFSIEDKIENETTDLENNLGKKIDNLNTKIGTVNTDLKTDLITAINSAQTSIETKITNTVPTSTINTINTNVSSNKTTLESINTKVSSLFKGFTLNVSSIVANVNSINLNNTSNFVSVATKNTTLNLTGVRDKLFGDCMVQIHFDSMGVVDPDNVQISSLDELGNTGVYTIPIKNFMLRCGNYTTRSFEFRYNVGSSLILYTILPSFLIMSSTNTDIFEFQFDANNQSGSTKTLNFHIFLEFQYILFNN